MAHRPAEDGGQVAEDQQVEVPLQAQHHLPQLRTRLHWTNPEPQGNRPFLTVALKMGHTYPLSCLPARSRRNADLGMCPPPPDGVGHALQFSLLLVERRGGDDCEEQGWRDGNQLTNGCVLLGCIGVSANAVPIQMLST